MGTLGHKENLAFKRCWMVPGTGSLLRALGGILPTGSAPDLAVARTEITPAAQSLQGCQRTLAPVLAEALGLEPRVLVHLVWGMIFSPLASDDQTHLFSTNSILVPPPYFELVNQTLEFPRDCMLLSLTSALSSVWDRNLSSEVQLLRFKFWCK